MVIELFAVHRPNLENIIGTTSEVREEIGKLHSRLPVTFPGSGGTHERGCVRLEESKSGFVSELLRHFLTVQLIQLWLVIKKIELRWGSCHEDKDAGFRLRFAMGLQSLKLTRVGSRGGVQQAILIQHRSQCDSSQPTR